MQHHCAMSLFISTFIIYHIDNATDLIEADTEKFKPCFVAQPEPEEVSEGQCARFVCRVTGYPKPRVMWLLNGHTVINVSLHLS